MIKEIEVGGVKHSITLADDMVGQGLVKDENGVVGIKTLTDEAKYNNLMSGIVADSDYGLCLNRYFVAIGLAGTGLEVEGNLLRVSTTGLMQDTVFISGLAYSLAGTGLTAIDGKLTVSGGSVDVNALCGSGLDAFDGKLYLNPRIMGSGLIYNINTPELDVHINRRSGLDFDYSTGSSPLFVKIASRTSGLRLFFNSNGELDITQD